MDAAGAAGRVGNPDLAAEAFDAMPLILATTDGPEHRLVAANAVYREFVGRADVLGVPMRELFPELAGQRLFELLDRAYRSGEPVIAHEWRVQLGQGADRPIQDRYLDFTLTPWRSDDGSVRGLLAAATDVTERVRERRRGAEAERRYRAARDVVTTLQEELLTTALPILPQVRISARYLMAAHDQGAGGDWFDAVPRPDGTVALVVGDVVGHGVAASAAMGQLRAVLEFLLTTELDLAAVLARIDGAARRSPAMRAATLAVVVLHPATGTLRYALYGHPPPLAIHPGGGTRFLATTGAGPLATDSPPTVATDVLAPDEMVLLYSDGLIERPGRTVREGMTELATVAADAAANRALPVGSPTLPAERVCQQTVELLTRAGYADDVTALAAHRLPGAIPAFTLDLTSAVPSLTRLRTALHGWLDDIDPTAENRSELELAVHEAVTNAIDHAYPADQPGPIRIEATLEPDGYVRCRIIDRGRWQPPDPTVVDRGRGLLLIDRMVDEMRLWHPPANNSDGGGGGTVVTIRHRLYRPALLASDTHATPNERHSAQPFGIDVNTDAPTPCVRVRGPVDITTADRLATALLAAARGGLIGITVDLTAVTELGSAGVLVLHRCRRESAAHQQEFTILASAGSTTHTVLGITGLPCTTTGTGSAPRLS